LLTGGNGAEKGRASRVNPPHSTPAATSQSGSDPVSTSSALGHRPQETNSL